MNETRLTRHRITILTAVFVAVGVVLIAMGWRVMEHKDQDRLQLETEITAEQMRIRLERWIDDRSAVLAHVAETRHYQNEDLNADFHKEVGYFLDHFPDFQAINLVDASGRIVVVAPLESNLKALGKNLNDHPSDDVRESLARSRDQHAMVRTGTIQLLQGGKGFAIYRPLASSDDSLQGFINGVFRVDTLVETCLYEQALRERFDFRLSEADGDDVYVHGDTMPTSPVTVERTVRVVDRPWTLQVAPSAATLAAAANPAYPALSLAGILLLTIVGFLLNRMLARQAELSESRARYKLLVDHQAEMVIKTDPHGRCLYASPSFGRATDLNEQEITKRDLLNLVHPDDREECLAAYAAVLRPPHGGMVEFRIRTVDGWRWISWSTAVVRDIDGRIVNLIAVGRDVTPRRDLEEQLRQSQKMEAVGHLAGGIAHDFNNILQSIMGSLELAKMDLAEDHPVQADVDQALSSAERAAGLTRQLLAFSRRQVLQPCALELNDVVSGMRGLLERTVGDAMTVTFGLCPEPGLIHADGTQVQQVLLNLCVNARDAVMALEERTGGIRVSTSRVDLDADFCRDHSWARPGSYMVLEVADTGCGMAPELLELVFEPFFTTKRDDGGTGLGLSTVYGIVNQHEGLIQLTSSPGHGTTFRIHFARETEATAAATQVMISETSVGGTETVLLAEDDASVRDFAVKTLERAGYTVLAAADGPEALQLFSERSKDVDLALLDVVMPGMSGRDVHDRLREQRPELPILFCSGYDGNSLHTRFILDAGLELLPKPYERKALLGRIRSLLNAAADVRA